MLESMTGESRHILIVDDSNTQARLLGYMLENSGYTVTMANSAAAALDIITKNYPSLVITDVVMPGMTGYELCASIKNNSLTSGIPVILLTSLSSPQDIVLALQCGADDFISKPYDNDFLIQKLEKFFNRPAKAAEILNTEDSEEVTYSDKKYMIPLNRQKMLDLMISVYEGTIQKNRELIQAQVALVETNRQLETIVIEKQKAIEDVRIKENLLHKLNSGLNVMNRLGAVINQSITLDELLPRVAEEIIKSGILGKQQRLGIWLNDKDGKPERAVIYNNGSISEIDFKKEEHVPLCGDLSAQEQLSVITACSSPLCPWKETGPGGSHGHICILLIARDRRVGMVNLVTDKGPYPEMHVLEMLTSLGEQFGMAIENHNLFLETKRLSLYDPLTGLANRRMIDITLNAEITRAKRYGKPFCLVFLDIDLFKQYNDRFGHDEGDRILTALGNYLKKNVRNTDLAGRFGGEEFIILLSEADLQESQVIAQRHLSKIHEHAGITVSMGIAEYSVDQSVEELIKSADAALYRAKEKGRNRVELSN